MKNSKKTEEIICLEKVNSNTGIYHYTNSKGVMGMIEDGAFWATKSDFLNDPQEFRYITQVVEDIGIENIENKVWRDIFLKAYRKRNLKAGSKGDVYYAHKEYYVLSFSLLGDSITLWSEFSNETGYNMEFDYERLLEKLEKLSKLIWHGKVIYEKDRQQQLLLDLLLREGPRQLNTTFEEIMQGCVEKGSSQLFEEYMDIFQRVQNVYAMFFKKEGFQEENEYRFIVKKMREDRVYFREQEGFMIPYMNIPISDGRHQIPVKSLKVSPQNHTDLAQKGMAYYMSSKGYKVPVALSDLQLRY